QHVRHQGGLAAARHAVDADQPAERELDIDAAQVVGAGALHDEPRRGARDGATPTRLDAQPAAEVASGEGVGEPGLVGTAVEDDPSAALARPGTDVDQPV